MKQTEKKSSKDENTPWMKWAYVGIALLVAVAMVGTYLTPMFEKKLTAEAGKTALIGYTIRAEDGRPLVTTDQDLLASEYKKGNHVLLTSSMEIPVGAQLTSENIVPVPILYPEGTGFSGFGLMGFETNAISAGLVGMQIGETRMIPFSYGENNLAMSLSRESRSGSRPPRKSRWVTRPPRSRHCALEKSSKRPTINWSSHTATAAPRSRSMVYRGEYTPQFL